MNKTPLRTAGLIGAVALPLLFAAQPASATFYSGVQRTNYTGGSCHPTNASNAAHAQVDGKGRIFNTSPTQVLAVQCPMARDSQDGKQAAVVVYAIDQKAQPGSSLTCKFSMINSATGDVHSQSLFGTGDTVSSPTQAQFIQSAFMPRQNMGLLTCFIPPADAGGNKQSGIGGFTVIDTVQ